MSALHTNYRKCDMKFLATGSTNDFFKTIFEPWLTMNLVTMAKDFFFYLLVASGFYGVQDIKEKRHCLQLKEDSIT